MKMSIIAILKICRLYKFYEKYLEAVMIQEGIEHVECLIARIRERIDE